MMLYKNNGEPKASMVFPKVLFDVKALLKMDTVINAEHDLEKEEIGWLGEVVRDGINFIVKDIFVPEQEVHATTTEITPDGMDKLINKLLDEGKEDTINSLKMWGHSHVNMSVSPSAQDNTTINDFTSKEDFFIRIIANKDKKIKIDLWDYNSGITYENLNMELNISMIDESNIIEDVKNNVKKKVSVIQKSYNAYNNYGSYNDYSNYTGYGSSYYKKKKEKKEKKEDEIAKQEKEEAKIINSIVDMIEINNELLTDIIKDEDIVNNMMKISELLTDKEYNYAYKAYKETLNIYYRTAFTDDYKEEQLAEISRRILIKEGTKVEKIARLSEFFDQEMTYLQVTKIYDIIEGGIKI